MQLARHLLGDAEAVYNAVRDTSPDEPCARLGLAAVAGERAVAVAKLTRGLAAAGRAVGLARDAAKRREAAGKLATDERQPKLDAAAKLDEQVQVARRQARGAFTAALAHHRAFARARKALDALPPEPKKPKGRVERGIESGGDWVQRGGAWAKRIFLDRADDAGRLAAVAAFWLLVAAVAAAMALRLLLLIKPLGRWMHHRSWLRRLAGRPLVFGTVDGEDVDLVWQLRDALGTASAPLGQSVDLATGTDNVDQVLEGVNGALAKLPQGQLLAGAWSLLRLLVSRAPLKVDGKILPKGARGYGVSLTVARGRHVIRTTTLCQQTYELGPVPADEKASEPPWQRLAIAGGAWAQYVWLDFLGGKLLTKRLGTADWQSFAYLLVGCDIRARNSDDDLPLAQAMFALALDRDPENQQALFNLAVVDRRCNEPGQAIERLTRLQSDVSAADTPDRVAPALRTLRDLNDVLGRELQWFQATYNLAAAYVQRYLPKYVPGQAVVDVDFAQALLYSRTLVHDIELALAAEPSGALSLRRSDLIAVEGPAIALLAGLRAMQVAGHGVTGKAVVAPTRDEIINATRTRSPSPDELVSFLLHDAGRAGYRARYNLACFYSRLATMKSGDERTRLFKRALEELAYAVEPGDLTDLATTDSGLKELREGMPAEFWKTLRRPAPDELARLRAIGPAFAAKLTANGVETVAQLVVRTSDHNATVALAQSSCAPVSLVARWRRLVRLVATIEGLDIDSANLLDAAGVGSFKALADAVPGDLTLLLAAVAATASPPAAAPSGDTVEKWVEQALTLLAAAG